MQTATTWQATACSLLDCTLRDLLTLASLIPQNLCCWSSCLLKARIFPKQTLGSLNAEPCQCHFLAFSQNLKIGPSICFWHTWSWQQHAPLVVIHLRRQLSARKCTCPQDFGRKRILRLDKLSLASLTKLPFQHHSWTIGQPHAMLRLHRTRLLTVGGERFIPCFAANGKLLKLSSEATRSVTTHLRRSVQVLMRIRQVADTSHHGHSRMQAAFLPVLCL